MAVTSEAKLGPYHVTYYSKRASRQLMCFLLTQQHSVHFSARYWKRLGAYVITRMVFCRAHTSDRVCLASSNTMIRCYGLVRISLSTIRLSSGSGFIPKVRKANCRRNTSTDFWVFLPADRQRNRQTS